MFIWEGNLSGPGAYFLIYLVVQGNSSHHILQLLFPLRQLHHPGVLASEQGRSCIKRRLADSWWQQCSLSLRQSSAGEVEGWVQPEKCRSKANAEFWASSRMFFSMSAFTPPLSSSHQIQRHTWLLCPCVHVGCCFWVPRRNAQDRYLDLLSDKWSEQHFNGLEWQGISYYLTTLYFAKQGWRVKACRSWGKDWDVGMWQSKVLIAEEGGNPTAWGFHSRKPVTLTLTHSFLVSFHALAQIKEGARCLLGHSPSL